MESEANRYLHEWCDESIQTIAYWTMGNLVEARDEIESVILQLEAAASVLPGERPLAKQIKQLGVHKDMLNKMAETFAEKMNAVGDYLEAEGRRQAAILDLKHERQEHKQRV